MAGLTFGGLFSQDPQYSDDGKLSIEGEQGFASRNQTQVFVTGSVTGVNSSTVYTVAAGKVFYIAQMSVSLNRDTATACWFDVLIGAGRIIRQYITNGANSQCHVLTQSFTMPLKLIAAETLVIQTGDAGAWMSGSFQGWLEDA